MIFGLEQEGGSLIAPMALAHPLHPIDNRSRTGAKTCGLDDVFPPDDLCSRPEALCKYIYIYIYAFEFCYRTFEYIQQECHSVLVKLHPITFYMTVFLGSAPFLG